MVQVAKWGNSLAIRIPQEIVKKLRLKEGDHVEIAIADKRHFRVRRDQSRERAIQVLQKLSRPLPRGFRFDRDVANER